MRFKKRSWAYYGRNDSYSKSLNAENAEADGRYPKSRAAKELGLSLKAFKTGLHAADYTSNEWHHVGKYATAVSYFDTKELNNDWKFWFNAAKEYKSKVKRLELIRKAAQIKVNNYSDFIFQRQEHKKSQSARKLELEDKFGKIGCCYSIIGELTETNWLKRLEYEKELVK